MVVIERRVALLLDFGDESLDERLELGRLGAHPRRQLVGPQQRRPHHGLAGGVERVLARARELADEGVRTSLGDVELGGDLVGHAAARAVAYVTAAALDNARHNPDAAARAKATRLAAAITV